MKFLPENNRDNYLSDYQDSNNSQDINKKKSNEKLNSNDIQKYSTYDHRDMLPMQIHTYQKRNKFYTNISRFETNDYKVKELKLSKTKMDQRYQKDAKIFHFPVEFMKTIEDPELNLKANLFPQKPCTVYNKWSKHEVTENIKTPKYSEFNFSDNFTPICALKSVYNDKECQSFINIQTQIDKRGTKHSKS